MIGNVRRLHCVVVIPLEKNKEIKIGGHTSSLLLLITSISVGGLGGNVPIVPKCYVLLAFRVLSLYIFPEIIISGRSLIPFFTVDGR